MRDIRLALMTGVDIPIPELQLIAHPPIIEEIARMGERDFFSAMQYLCLDKEMLVQDKTILMSLTNFQVLMKVLEQSEDKSKKMSIQTLLLLMFPSYKTVMLPNSILLSAENMPVVAIDDNNFSIFQEYIRKILCVNNVFQGGNIVYNPANDAAKAIADKLMAGRRKVAQLKSNGGTDSVLTRYLSILTVSKVATLKECSQYNLFQLFDIMERYSAFVEWDVDLRVRLAGGKPDKTVENWMREMHPTL